MQHFEMTGWCCVRVVKALVKTGKRNMELREVELPAISAGELLLRIQYTGICGSDLSNYKKEHEFPVILGHEYSGIVEEVGSAADGFAKGDLVAVNPITPCETCYICRQGRQQNCPNLKIKNRGFAEFVNVSAANCHRVSDALSGAIVEPLACGVHAAGKARIALGDTVVIFGAGMIGLVSMKAAELNGAARRILVDTNPRRLALAAAWGATDTINPSETNVVAEIEQLTQGAVQQAIDAVGLAATRQQAVQVVEKGGRVIFVGLHHDDTVLPGNTIVSREVEILGSSCYAHSDFARAISLVENRIVVPDRTWLDVRPLEEGKAAFDEQTEGSAPYPKIVLTALK